MHLLAAEDNELNAEIIEMLLTDDGAKVTVAKNGRQAVEYFESNPPGTFDAILMDVMMPVMDGIAATKSHTCHGQGRCKNNSDHCNDCKCI